MSKFLETPNGMLSRDSLHAIAGKYILEELHKTIGSNLNVNYYLNDNGKAEMQKILDISNQKLRMYGSAQDLAENLRIYRNFPGMDKFFEIEQEAYSSAPAIYKSLKGEEYICKLDIFVILQNMTRSIFPGSNSEQIRLAIIAPLKSYQKEHPSKYLEFVKYDQSWFNEIEKELREAEDHCYRYAFEMELLDQQFRRGDFKSFTLELERFSDPKTWNEAEMTRNVKQMYEAKKDAEYLAFVFLKAAIMKTLQVVVEKRSGVFLPSKTVPKTLRVFEVDDERFLMKAEFFEALQIGYKDENDNFLTISMREVEERYGDRVSDLEFIRFPILRAKHRAVPIHEPSSTVKFCVPAVDGFFDFAKTLIFGIKIFQKYKVSDLNELFKRIEYGFLADEKNPYFISMKGIEDLKFYTCQLIDKICNIGTTKDARNAKKDGFTVQNLKNELAHLNLLNAFPDIQNHAEAVYSEVDKMKKEPVLRTCDLFDAIEHCQLICILDRLPNYKKFLHSQKGCHRVYGYKCDHCDSGRYREKNKKKRDRKKAKLAQKKKMEDSESSNKDSEANHGENPKEIQETSAPESQTSDQVEGDDDVEKIQKTIEMDRNSSRIENLEKELAQMKLTLEKILENQKRCNGNE